MRELMVAGGSLDPSIETILHAAKSLGVRVLPLLTGEQGPALTWSLPGNELIVNGAAVNPDGLFIRQDVFSFLNSGSDHELSNSEVWYSSVMGWALSNRSINVLNRSTSYHLLNKMNVLCMAMKFGLAVPDSLVSNEQEVLEARRASAGDHIAKPVTGGSYTQKLPEAMKGIDWRDGLALLPAFVQEALVYPEYRVYRVRDHLFIFEITSGAVDYRTDAHSKIVSLPEERFDQGVLKGLVALADELKLDFCAFDLKTRPVTREIIFLEVNSAPMFAEFDRISEGVISTSLVEALTQT